MNTVTVLQLEIFHGVLNNPDAAKKRSFFYMRKPPVEAEMDENEYKVRSSTGLFFVIQLNEIHTLVKHSQTG